jgi:hypothetical protein
MSKVMISTEDLVWLAKDLYGKHVGDFRKEVPEGERAHWLGVAELAAGFFRTSMLEPGMKSRLLSSGDVPATLVEVVSVRFETLATIRLPDGSTCEASVDSLIDWGADFGWTSVDENGKEWISHIDSFNSDHRPHPLTGESWRGRVEPDVLKAAALLSEAGDK